MDGHPPSGKTPAIDYLFAGLGILALVAALWLDQASVALGHEPPPVAPSSAGKLDRSPTPSGNAVLEAVQNLQSARVLLDMAERSSGPNPVGEPVSRDRIALECRNAIVEVEQERRAAYIHTTTQQQVAAATGYASRITTMCGLSEAQDREVLAILQEQVRAYEPVMLAATVDMASIHKIDESTDARILALMAPEQAAKWPKARRAWLQSWANRSGDR